jgi:3-isopropylmalate dehydrogenase
MKPEKLLTFLGPKDTGNPLLLSATNRPIGVIPGAGIGPEVMGAALEVLRAVETATGNRFEILEGGPVGEEAEERFGTPLPESVIHFCRDIFERGGAVLSGPGGGRYVYELRRRFDLFCKFVPIRPCAELAQAGRIAASHLQNVDILIVRDNAAGVYQGEWGERVAAEGRIAHHSFNYSESQARRILEVAARAAAGRRGTLHVILKDGGIPTISALWREVGGACARQHDVHAVFMNVDLAAYELIQNPCKFDVVAAPNLFGDILADIAGVLLATRGVTFSGNYDGQGNGVYQTNHGCAHDLAGSDTANPAGQIFSLAMLLRESLGLDEAASLMECALAETWREGWRTADVEEPGCRVAGTRAMGKRVATQVARVAEAKQLA